MARFTGNKLATAMLRGAAPLIALVALAAGGSHPQAARADTQITNVSYDPTRELYQDFNRAFARYWKTKTGQTVSFQQSHGGSSKQARAVIEGLPADVVTLGLPSDITAIQNAGLINPGWQSRFADNSTPYTSTVVFVVRKGNPKGIHDWADLVRPGVSIVTPNPKTSAGGHMAYYGAFAYALDSSHGNAQAAKDFVSKLYKNTPLLPTGARAATTAFVQNGIGDVMIAWENEAQLTVTTLGKGQYQIVYPSVSVLAEPSVAVVDKVAAQHNTTAVATAYLQYLYSPEGQAIAAKHFYRPRDPKVFKQYAAQFPKIRLLTIEKTFGGWDAAQKSQLNDGGVFDQIFHR
ncbi:MAG: sulfate ABC transporter substrate-binding protein [Capsulimonadaceae bacterium]